MDSREKSSSSAGRQLLEMKITPLFFSICLILVCVRGGYIGDRIPATFTAGFAGLVVILLLLFSAINKKRIHPVVLAIAGFSAAVILSTFINGGNYVTALYRVLPPLAVSLLFGYLESAKLNGYLNQIAFWGSVFILIDGLTMILYPNGMYTTGLYTGNWLLGYKSQRIWFGLPIVVFLCVNSFRKKGKLGIWSIIVALVLAATSYYAEATMGTVSALLLIAFFYVIKLASNKVTGVFIRWLLDFRIWAIVSVAVAALFVLVSQNDLALQIAQMFGKSADLSGRDRVWQATIAAWTGSPFLGIGALTSPQYILLTGVYGGTNAHSFILAVLASGGIIGFIFVLYAYIRAFFNYRPRTVSSSSIIALGVTLCLFIGITSCNTFELFTLPLLVLLARANEEKGFLCFS